VKAIENCSERNEPLGRVLQSVANRFRRLGDENLQKEGITLCQLRVIVFIAKSKGSVPQKDLEDAFEIRRSSVTGILKNMEKNGLIRREISLEDGRVKRLLLSWIKKPPAVQVECSDLSVRERK